LANTPGTNGQTIQASWRVSCFASGVYLHDDDRLIQAVGYADPLLVAN
jgi:hypothetical protein